MTTGTRPARDLHTAGDIVEFLDARGQDGRCAVAGFGVGQLHLARAARGVQLDPFRRVRLDPTLLLRRQPRTHGRPDRTFLDRFVRRRAVAKLFDQRATVVDADGR